MFFFFHVYAYMCLQESMTKYTYMTTLYFKPRILTVLFTQPLYLKGIKKITYKFNIIYIYSSIDFKRNSRIKNSIRSNRLKKSFQ